MQVKRLSAGLSFLFVIILLPNLLKAQVNAVEFGKNRVQNKKFVWKFYQSPNFNVYFNQGGLELAKYVVQVAEEELSPIEQSVEYSLQRRANIVIYDNYEDYKTSNIGLGIDWQNAGGVTKLVNNKMVVYFDGNHNTLRIKIREGIAKILSDNILFGDDIGEFASNAALLDLPQWLTDGYVRYIAEPWNQEKDDELKSSMLSGDYKNFYAFAFDKPNLAGNALWYYVAEKYKPENVTYFLYLARLYKNLNTASQRICKKKFKDVLADFMEYEQQKYENDLKQRKNAPKGKLTIVEEADKKIDYFKFAANPNPKNNSYAVVKFKGGVYSIKYIDNLYDEHILLKYGFKMLGTTVASNYPLLAWDGKGSRLLVIYTKDEKTYMFVYDAIAGIKRFKQEIEGFDQILDAGFMLDANTLLFSAVKNGHSDIFTYKIDNGKVKAITNDVYDDLDPAYVSFPNRTGIIFASNRPGPGAAGGDTAIPSRNHYNIFLVDLLNNGDMKQITQLTKVKYGNARYPAPYNTNHFTYVNDENGIANRWAGFFTTQRDGLDTLYYIGDEILRNPGPKEIDSTLSAWQKQEPDSISYFQVFKDSTYTFPITNYQSSLLESKVSGNNEQVSEVRREGDEKFLYKLKVDSVTLRRRNITARPTDYIKKLIQQERLAGGRTSIKKDSTANKPKKNIFQNEFEDDKSDSAKTAVANNSTTAITPGIPLRESALTKSSLFDYRLKFNADYVLAGVTNNILVNRYQPFANGAGPIQLNNGNDLDFSFRVGVSDIMEDVKFIGGIRFGTSLSDKDIFFSFQNFRRRLDWGLTYYRSNINNFSGLFTNLDPPYYAFDNGLYTNLYQLNLSFPTNEVNSIRAMFGFRSDRAVLKPYNNLTLQSDPNGLPVKDSMNYTGLSHFEFVHDNTINPVQNIWNGLRWKVYLDMDFPLTNQGSNSAVVKSTGKPIYNLGFDARNYYKIYRNFIWAVRAAGDFSFGDAKIIYYLGGVDGWISPKFNKNTPADFSQNYAYQSLAINMRGFTQNIANGNNAMVINSELRLPIFTTFFNKPINNAFIRNFQLIQFIDLGTAWAGSLKNIERPTYTTVEQPVTFSERAGGIGPFAGGYGFGARSTLLGYFLKVDAGWPMDGLFRGSPVWYFALGFDF